MIRFCDNCGKNLDVNAAKCIGSLCIDVTLCPDCIIRCEACDAILCKSCMRHCRYGCQAFPHCERCFEQHRAESRLNSTYTWEEVESENEPDSSGSEYSEDTNEPSCPIFMDVEEDEDEIFYE